MSELPSNEEILKKHSTNIKDFSDLLDKIEDLDDKKKALWKQIYENALNDRQNAYMLFIQLHHICQDKSTEHAVHGRTMSGYIERMSRANDQLIKLAELVRRAEEKSDEIDNEELFAKISGKK